MAASLPRAVGRGGGDAPFVLATTGKSLKELPLPLRLEKGSGGMAGGAFDGAAAGAFSGLRDSGFCGLLDLSSAIVRSDMTARRAVPHHISSTPNPAQLRPEPVLPVSIPKPDLRCRAFVTCRTPESGKWTIAS